MQKKALFICSAGRGVGLGHLSRSLVAAQSLTSRLDAQVDFVAVGQNIDNRYARDFGVNFSSIYEPIDKCVDRLTKHKSYTVICLDLFGPFVEKGLGLILENLRETKCLIIAIDALVGLENLIDLLYVPSYLPPSYIDAIKFQDRLAYGWNAYLLNIRSEVQASEQSESILVLTGGSDVTNLGLDLPKILNRCLPFGSKVNWVTGPFSKPPIFPNSANVEFMEYVAPAGLGALMHSAKIAITIFGVSFFELIAIGVPTVVFSPYNGKDSRELKGIAEEKIALVAEDAEDAVKQAAILLRDCHLRAELSENAKGKLKSFDGEYFAEKIRELLATKTKNVSSSDLLP